MQKPTGRLLQIKGIAPKEVAYNPAVIVQRNENKIVGGANIIAARVENLKSHWQNPALYNPHVMFFTRVGDLLEPVPSTPIFDKYEDPWATWITRDGQLQLVFGGVKVDYTGDKPVVTTQIHMAKSVQELSPNAPFCEVRGMKDVRLAQLLNGRFAILTRPTTGEAAPGRIGFVIVENLKDIGDPAIVANAQLLQFNINAYSKIGANEVFFNPETGLLHVICHIADTEGLNFDDEISAIHYGAYEFKLDPEDPFSGTITPRLVADRASFPENTGPSKGKRFNDVVFPGGTGGLEQKELFVGIEDARVGVIDLK